jgi:hypothetical protein
VTRQSVRGVPTTAWRRALPLGPAVALLAACSSAPPAPLYTAQEEKAICERHSGWWHSNLLDGFCERR